MGAPTVADSEHRTWPPDSEHRASRGSEDTGGNAHRTGAGPHSGDTPGPRHRLPLSVAVAGGFPDTRLQI